MAFNITILDGKTDHIDVDFMAWAKDILDGNSGIVGANDFLVTQNSPLGMSILVASGVIYQYISSTGSYYRGNNTTASTSLNISSNSSGSTRIDLICVKIDLTQTPDADGGGVASLVVVSGTPGSGIPATPANHYKLAEVTVASGAATITNTNITDKRAAIKVNPYMGISSYGWISESHTLAYASATSVTIAGVDLTATYTKGTRVKFTNNSTTYYGVVASSSFSTDTTITFIANTDYSIANSAITNPYYSYAVNPQGYPGWFNVTPTVTNPTGATGALSKTYARFAVTGKTITFIGNYGIGTIGGTITGTSYNFTLPITLMESTYGAYVGAGQIRQGGIRYSGIVLSNSGTSIDVWRYDNAALTDTTVEVTFNIIMQF